MQDYLREIEGTLARTNERKNTLLYKLAKQKAEEERLSRLGLRKIPSNPLEVTDVKVVKLVLFRLKQDIGDKIAKLRNVDLFSVEKDGEAVIRSKNDEINVLLTKRNVWERRLAVLENKSYSGSRSKKIFFGCAKNLPEAPSVSDQPRDTVALKDGDEIEVDSSSSHISDNEDDNESSQPHSSYIKQLMSCSDEESLRKVEQVVERRFREEQTQKRGRDVIGAEYIVDVVLPSEEDIRRELLERTKNELKKKIESLKGK